MSTVEEEEEDTAFWTVIISSRWLELWDSVWNWLKQKRKDDYVLADWWGSRGCAPLIMDQTFHDLMRFREIFAKCTCRDIAPQERLQPSGNPRSLLWQFSSRVIFTKIANIILVIRTGIYLIPLVSTWEYMSATIGQGGTTDVYISLLLPLDFSSRYLLNVNIADCMVSAV